MYDVGMNSHAHLHSCYCEMFKQTPGLHPILS
jgi:hypothetical protein